jgi:KDO2-lipid IV(A) lauroyltransferase
MIDAKRMTAEGEIAEPGQLSAMTWDERRDFAIYRLMRALPVSAVSRLGASLGLHLGRRAHRDADARVAAAIKQLRPDLALDPPMLEAAQTRLWANVGRVYAEFSVLDKMVPREHVTIEDPRLLDKVLAAGRPVILAYVHLGNWEASAVQISLRVPGRLCALADPPPANRTRAHIVTSQRGRCPAKVLTINPMVWRQAMIHLQQPGGLLFISIDETGASGVSVPSFGRAPDYQGNLGKIVRIAMRTGAIVLPIYSERIAGATFRTKLLPPIDFTERREATAEEHSHWCKHLDDLFAPVVLRLIDQWFGLLVYR